MLQYKTLCIVCHKPAMNKTIPQKCDLMQRMTYTSKLFTKCLETSKRQ